MKKEVEMLKAYIACLKEEMKDALHEAKDERATQNWKTFCDGQAGAYKLAIMKAEALLAEVDE